jgi:hypothetical protein
VVVDLTNGCVFAFPARDLKVPRAAPSVLTHSGVDSPIEIGARLLQYVIYLRAPSHREPDNGSQDATHYAKRAPRRRPLAGGPSRTNPARGAPKKPVSTARGSPNTAKNRQKPPRFAAHAGNGRMSGSVARLAFHPLLA